MRRLSEFQNFFITTTLVDIGIEFYDDNKSPIELFNIWAERTGQKINDPDWVNFIVTKFSQIHNEPKETWVRVNNTDKKTMDEIIKRKSSH